jgi:hypothetical protein
VTAFVLGCGAAHEDEAPAATAAAPSCELGTGASSFIAVHDGDRVPIIFGPQGGYHVWGSVRAKGLSSKRVVLRYRLTAASGVMLDPVSVVVDLAPAPDGGDAGLSQSVGTRVFVQDPAAIRETTVAMSVTATDPEGRTCESSRSIVPYQ